MKGIHPRHIQIVRKLLVFFLGWFVVSYLILETSLEDHSSFKLSVVDENEPTIKAAPGLADTASFNNAGRLETVAKSSMEPVCAPWIPSQDRKVLFVELHSWDMYYGPSKYKTGEYYVSATWDYALRRNGFQVDRVSTRHFFERMKPSEMRLYHRIFFRDPKWHPHFRHRDILCKTRPMYYFGEWYQNKVKDNEWFQWPFDKRQILVAHPEEFNTFMGYFPHNLILNTTTPRAERGRVGLLYGKKPEYFTPYQALIRRLISEGFVLHSTCTDNNSMKCPFPSEVIQHQNLGPSEYSKLLSSFSFMLGFQKPPGSPSPMVGLSYGVSFLNPIRDNNEANYTQHKALSRLGMPYVYNVNLMDHDAVVQAAEWSTRYRFSSYVPAEFRIGSLVDRMCALLEDDALCMCPNPQFGDDQLDVRLNGSIVKDMDCRASVYVKKQPIFPKMNWHNKNINNQQGIIPNG